MKRFVEKLFRYSRVYGYTAAGVVAVVGVLVYEKSRRNLLYSSWTTNYDPSVKWDYNWDSNQTSLSGDQLDKGLLMFERTCVDNFKLYLANILHGNEPGKGLCLSPVFVTTEDREIPRYTEGFFKQMKILHKKVMMKTHNKREAENVVKPLKESATDDQKAKHQDDLAKLPTATRHIILIRHGQYFDTEKLDINRKLTELGREQAAFTGARLADMNYPWSKLISSTMTRAKETADIIHKHVPDLPREESDLLREGAPIPPEPPSGNWRPEKHFYSDGSRIEAAFRKYFHRADSDQTNDSYEIMVCHANVIRYFVCRALQFPPEGWLRISLNHASITWIYIRPNGRVGIRTMGESGFMPVNKVSVL